MAGLEGKIAGGHGLETGGYQENSAENTKLDEIYRDLFREDYEGVEPEEQQDSDIADFNFKEAMDRMFADDFNEVKDLMGKSADMVDQDTDRKEKVFDEAQESDAISEGEGNIYERDDKGTIFKTNGELNPDTEYIIDGVAYQTDGQGRIISCDGNVKQTPEGERDQKAQKEVGGEDRREGDQGGHIISRTLGGAKGIENLLPIRGTINNGPYKSMENEINQALSEGKDVSVHVDVKYDGDSQRPSKIIVICITDGKETVSEYDNDEGSTDLMDSIEDKVDKEQYNDLKQEIEDANADGGTISVIAVKTEYDRYGDITKVTVTLRDESIGGPNEKRVILPKGDAE